MKEAHINVRVSAVRSGFYEIRESWRNLSFLRVPVFRLLDEMFMSPSSGELRARCLLAQSSKVIDMSNGFPASFQGAYA